jgi:hypothetical protein
MTGGSARSDLGLGRTLSVACDSEVGPSVVVAGRTLGSCFACRDPRLFVVPPGSEVWPQPGLTLGCVFAGWPFEICLCHRFPVPRVGPSGRMMNP